MKNAKISATALVLGLGVVTGAHANPFMADKNKTVCHIENGKQVCTKPAKASEGKCGEGKCGAPSAKATTTNATTKATTKTVEAKCGEGKCGGHK